MTTDDTIAYLQAPMMLSPQEGESIMGATVIIAARNQANMEATVGELQGMVKRRFEGCETWIFQ